MALGEVAGEKHGISLGDQVTSEQICPCDVCRYCERGAYQMCIPHDVYGFHQCTQGAMADYVLLPARARNHKIDKSVPPVGGGVGGCPDEAESKKGYMGGSWRLFACVISGACRLH